MTIVTMLNQKGGVGKTSTCHHLSGALGAMGKRVLLVDNDPQSSLSQGFFGPAEVRDLEPDETIAAIYSGRRPFPSQLIRSTGFERIDIVPGSRAATPFNVPEPDAAPWEQQVCIRDFLDAVRADCDYDLVVIDCPPNLHLASYASLVASDFLMVPLQPEDYGAQGIKDVQESLALVKAQANPRVELLGYLLTMVGKGTIHASISETLREEYGADVFAEVFPNNLAYKEAITVRKPISIYKPKGAPAKAVQRIGEELLRRIEAVEAKAQANLAEVA